MHLRSTSVIAFILACQLAPGIGFAGPKIRPLDQPKLDKDGADYQPLSLLPPAPAKLTRREKIAAGKAARAAARHDKQASGAAVSDEAAADEAATPKATPGNTQVASLDPAVAAPSAEAKRSASPAETPQTGVRALIAHHAASNGVPFHLADAMVKIESRYNPRASNGVNFGLGQLNLRTAHSLGYKGGAAGLFDANTNLTYAIKYLAQAYRLARGDTCGTVTRYQNGFGATRMSGANRAYCAKVKAHAG